MKPYRKPPRTEAMRAFWLVFAFTAAQTAHAQVDQPVFDWTGAIPAGATLHIADAEGNIRVTGTSGGQVRVHGERTHVISGNRALIFEVVDSRQDVIICARYADGYCDARGVHGGEGFHVGIGGHSPTADFTVELPAGVKLAANSGDGSIDVRDAGADIMVSSGDGSIRVQGVTGEVQAKSGDGSITVENATRAVTAHTGDGSIAITTATGPIDATSGDGDIEVHLAKNANPGDVRLHTGDGSVTLFLASQFGGQLDASTSDGHIESEMPLALSGRMDSRHLYATVGPGGDSRLSIRTGDGDIRIKRE
jgi:Putative adhesin